MQLWVDKLVSFLLYNFTNEYNLYNNLDKNRKKLVFE